jgi:hypothetical protein
LNSTISISCLILSISIQSTYALVIPVALWWRLIQDLLQKFFFEAFSPVHSIYSFLKKEGIGCHSIGARDYNSKRTPCSGKWRSSSRSFVWTSCSLILIILEVGVLNGYYNFKTF